MEISVRVKNNTVILDLSGRIDVDSANFVETVGQCIRDGYLDIICNFEGVEFIDYVGISVLLVAYKEVVNNNGRMKFTNIPAHLRNLFSITGSDKIIDIYPNEEMALSSLKEDKVIENIKKLKLRRRFKRLPIDIKVELKSKNEKSPTCLKVDILDLSAIGAYIYGCNKFKLQDELILKLKLPPKFEEMELEAKVVWLSDKQNLPQLHPGMGIEFHHITSSDQKKIIEFIERNLSLTPTDN